jgi:hypothetical protein
LGSSQVVAAADAPRLAKELAAGGDAGAAVAGKQVRVDRMLKLSAASGGRVVVAYWGGMLRVVDSGGGVLSEQQMPQDVTALAWHDGKVIAGLADGRLLALEVPPGKR